jgi:hypothetical protein
MRRCRSLLAAIILAFGVSISPGEVPQPGAGAAWAQRNETLVSFNTSTLKYHGVNCRWARKCTKNCVVIPLSEAIQRGGVPCKVCGGH